MMMYGQLFLALHALGHMAAADQPLRSEAMAAHLGTNAVVVRRVLAPLREAGILHSGKGRPGGWRLARDPASVSVAEVQRALGERLRPAAAARPPRRSGCATQAAVHAAVDAALAEAEALLAGRLGRVTVADLAAGLAPAAAPAPT